MIEVSGILSTAGAVKDYVLDFEPDYYEIHGQRFPITTRTKVELTLTNKSRDEIQVAFHMNLSIEIPCDRCLKSVIKHFDLDFDDLISFKEDEENEDIKSGYVVGYNLDVDKLVCDEILVNWPIKILCSDNCKGVCGSCGKNLNLGTCDCQDTGLDLRMAVIQDIFKGFKEV